MAKDAKMVICIRRDLHCRRGKECSQAAHSAISFITRRMRYTEGSWHLRQNFPEATQSWLENGFAKICVQVQTEKELLEVYNQANEAKLEVHLIKDSGTTEFHGVPTITCLAIGPNWSEDIDKITGNLRLY